MLAHARPWLDAWRDSAYAADGFWRRERSADHFRTASSTSPLLALAVAQLLDANPEIEGVVELGAGAGQLLTALSALRPDLALAGVDVRQRPITMSDRVSWHQDLWDVDTTSWAWGPAERLLGTLGGPTLLLAVEWLDDLPCPVATRTEDGLFVLEVDAAGREQIGAPLGPLEGSWAGRWWPTGRRLESGTTRDHAWAAALRHLAGTGGLGLAIDYMHLMEGRPDGGSLTGYRSGREVLPCPDHTLNLTAAVAADALAAAGEAAGATTELLARQHEVLSGLAPASTSRDSDPLAALAALATRSQLAALTSPAVWGQQHWLLQAVPAAGAVMD